jgi:transcriptional regulator GlxA family with amidase domain
MRTKAHRVLVVVFEEVELLDVAAPVQVLSIAGRHWNFRPYKLEFAAEARGLVRTRNQLRIEAGAALSEAEPAEIVIVPGGYGARPFAERETALGHLARVAQGAKLLAATGTGVVPLARAGLVGGRKVAASHENAALLEPWVPPSSIDESTGLVLSESLITARQSGHAFALGLAIVERTLGPKLAEKVKVELGLGSDSERWVIRY